MRHLELVHPLESHEGENWHDIRVFADGHGGILLQFPANATSDLVCRLVSEMSVLFYGKYSLTTPETDRRLYDEFTARRNAKRITYYFAPDKPDSLSLDEIRVTLEHLLCQMK